MSKLFDKFAKKRDITEEFLRPRYEDLPDPFLLPDMEKAVNRLLLAAKRGERVLICGDYDADGVTASALMAEILSMIGIKNVFIRLPHRVKDGYGLSKKIIQQCEKEKIGLVVTVDTGSLESETIGELGKRGISVVVTDHHECGEKLPECEAVVNPKRQDAGVAEGAKSRKTARTAGTAKTAESAKVAKVAKPAKVTKAPKSLKTAELSKTPESSKMSVLTKTPQNTEFSADLRDLAGVGVAFMVARALVLRGKIPAGQEKWLLDLVLIGTLCDSMPMTRTNRILCFYGQKVLAKTRRRGLRELMALARVKTINSHSVGFQLGPRLNAAGRLASADLALDLIRTRSAPEAARLAEKLEKINRKRKKLQDDAIMVISEHPRDADTPVIIEVGDWHEGVLGIIAGQLTELYRRPAFVFTCTRAGMKGSGRSFGKFDLAKAIDETRDLLLAGGGHAEACGATLKPENFPEWQARVQEYYKSLKLKNQAQLLNRKADLTLTEFAGLDAELVRQLKLLEPYAPQNEEPLFLLRDCLVQDTTPLGGEGQHLRFLLRDGAGRTLKVMGFFAKPSWFEIGAGEHCDAWVTLELNEWQGTASVEGRLERIFRV